MLIRENYTVDITEIDPNTVKMVTTTVSGDKVRMRREYTIAKLPWQSAEDVCIAAYPQAFTDQEVVKPSNDAPVPVSPTLTSENDSTDENPTLTE